MADTLGTILIVDDDPAAIELLSDYLGGKRLAVTRASNLDEALSELEMERPDAALISLRMGEGEGLEEAALLAMQRGVGGEKAEVIRALNTAGRLDEHMVRARPSVGLS